MLSKGMVYNGILPFFYCMKLNTKLNNTTFNKLAWNTLFIDNKVPTPQILGTLIKGKLSCDINEKAIIKPIQGCCGNGVSIFDKNNIPVDINCIIQEFIKPLDKKEIRSYRIITNCFKKDVCLWDIYLLTSNQIATNISQGGNIYKFNEKKREFTNSNKIVIKVDSKEYNYLKNAISYAIKCHRNLLFCPTIGWDVIINHEGPYFLEGNIGVAISTDLDNKMRENDYIDFIKPIYRYIMR
jgi:hypothetical protein